MILTDDQLSDYWNYMDGYWLDTVTWRGQSDKPSRSGWLPAEWAATCNANTCHVHVDERFMRSVAGQLMDRPAEATCLCDIWHEGTWLLTFGSGVYGDLFDPNGNDRWDPDQWFPEVMRVDVPREESGRWEFTAWHSFEDTSVEFGFDRGSHVALDEMPASICNDPLIRGALAVLFARCRIGGSF